MLPLVRHVFLQITRIGTSSGSRPLDATFYRLIGEGRYAEVLLDPYADLSLTDG